MGNNVSATVEIDPGTFTAGETVAGTIRLQVKKASPKTDVAVSISAEEKTFVAAPAADNRKFRYTTEMKWVLYELPISVPLNYSGTTVQPGKYDLRFQCPIPRNAPTSGSTAKEFYHNNCRLRHMIRVSIDKKEMAKEQFNVVCPVPAPSTTTEGKVIRPYLAGRGNISIGFVLDSTVVKPGATLCLRAVLRNRSNIPVQKIKIKVIEHKMWKTEPPKAQRGAHYLSDQSKRGFSELKIKHGPGLAMDKLSGRELKGVQPLVRKNNSFVMEPSVLQDITTTLASIQKDNGIDIKIPDGVNCSYKGVLITVSHRVKITVVAGRMKGDVTSFQIPFTVAHIP